jgi:hypothetical protein
MKQSRVKRLAIFFLFFFSFNIPISPCQKLRVGRTGGRTRMGNSKARRSMAAAARQHAANPRSGIYPPAADLSQAGCLHSYSCSPISDGTSNFIQPKAPILCDVVLKSPLYADQDTFAYPDA